MSPTTQRTRARRKKTRTLPQWLVFFSPLLAGILLTPIAIWGASVLAMSGPDALRLLYPYVTVIHGHSQEFATSQDEAIAQWVMYGQFPVYGLIWILVRRLARGSAGLFSVMLVHCAGVAAAIMKSP